MAQKVVYYLRGVGKLFNKFMAFMDEEIKKLLEENLRISKESLKLTKKLYHNLVWQRIKFFLKLFILVALVYLAIKFVPPFLDRLITPYKGIFEGIGNQLQQFQQIQKKTKELESFSPEELKKLLK